jgi:hypothetical protein
VAAYLEQGATGTATSGATLPNVPTAQDWYVQEHRPMPNQIKSSTLHKELRRLRWKTGVTTAMRGAGVIGLGTLAFQAGWEIGSELNSYIYGVDVPADPSPPDGLRAAGAVLKDVRLSWVNAGGVVPGTGGSALLSAIQFPEGGFVVVYDSVIWNGSLVNEASTIGRNAQCTTGHPSLEQFETLIGTSPTFVQTSQCTSGPNPFAPSYPATPTGYLVISPENMVNGKPMQRRNRSGDLTKCNGDQTCRKPLVGGTNDPRTLSHPTIQGNVQTQLTEAQYPTVIEWLEHLVAPETVADPMALEMPAPLPGGETFAQYRDRLRSMGFVGTITKVIASDATADDAFPVNTVIRTNPAVGTSVTDPLTDVDVIVNPDVMPEGGTGGEPAPEPTPDPNRPAPAADARCGPAPPAVDWGPLSGHDFSDKFPFGVFGWIAGTLGGWAGTASLPTLTIPMPGGIDDLVIDMGPTMDPLMDVIRPTMLVLAVFALMWLFASSALGFGRGGGD